MRSALAARVDGPTDDASPAIETHDLSLVTWEGPVYSGVELAFRRGWPAAGRGSVRQRSVRAVQGGCPAQRR